MSMSEAFSISFILVSGPELNSSPPEAKNPGVFRCFSNNLSNVMLYRSLEKIHHSRRNARWGLALLLALYRARHCTQIMSRK